jgi:hypothetical protein
MPCGAVMTSPRYKIKTASSTRFAGSRFDS